MDAERRLSELIVLKVNSFTLEGCVPSSQIRRDRQCGPLHVHLRELITKQHASNGRVADGRERYVVSDLVLRLEWTGP